MADVFISHASADRDDPGELAEALRSAGFTVWWDEEMLSGQRYHDTLTSQLSTARAVVVLWTPNAVRSDWVYSEARRASDQGKLVQARTPDVSIDDLPAPFDAYHCALVNETARIVRAVSALVRPQSDLDGPQATSPPPHRDVGPSAANGASVPSAGRLPPLLTPTVGRDEEASDIAGYLTSAGPDRLITLTGPGGTGKTRLAVEVARRAANGFPDGVWFVPLEPATTPDTAWRELARTLELPPAAHTSQGVLDHLARRHLLLVLDNLEQLRGIDEVVHSLLSRTAKVSVLATSRAAIHVTGEREHQVSALPVPRSDADTRAIEGSAAVQLFVQQAGRVNKGFALTEQNAKDVASICSALDGLPLAIELAAARVKLMSPAAILARPDHALDLAASERDRPERQRTLRDTIEWSVRLLPPDHQSVFAWLSVFSGTFDLAAVQALSDAMGGEVDCFAIVSDLVDSSLVETSAAGDEPRFVLLNTVRMFGLQQLRDSGPLAECTRAHAQHYVSRAKDLLRRRLAGGATRTEVLLDASNYRTLLNALPLRLTDPDRPGTALSPLQVVVLITGEWGYARMLVESKERLLASLIRFPSADDALGRAACLAQLGLVHFDLSEFDATLDRAEQALAALPDASPSGSRFESSPAWWASPLDIRNLAYGVQGHALIRREDLEGARRAAHSILDSGTERHEHLMGALELLILVARRADRFDEAEQLLLETRELFEGDPWDLAWFELTQADLDWCRGRHEQAKTRLTDSAELVIASDDPWLIYRAVNSLAIVIGMSHTNACATGLGCARAAERQYGFAFWDNSPEQTQEIIQQVRDRLGSPAWDEAYNAGMRTDLPTMLRDLRAAATEQAAGP